MQIAIGLSDHMVLQRDSDGASDARFEGSCVSAGAVEAHVACGGGVLVGFDWIEVGRARNGRFDGRLCGLPAGGPYDIRLRVRHPGAVAAATCSVRDVLVGDVWLLGDQSQMEGTGIFSEGSRLEPDARVRALFMHDVWDVAREPLHNVDVAVDPVHAEIDGGCSQREPFRQQGPGLAFGLDMHRRSGVPQGLIPCAHTATADQQSDGLHDLPGHGPQQSRQG